MNKEEYFKLRKLEKQKEEYEKIWEQLNNLFRWKNYFKKEDSKQALAKINEYIYKMRIPLNKTTREYNHLKYTMLSKCSHEILIKLKTQYYCAYCHNEIDNEIINSIKSKTIIDISEYPVYIYEDFIAPIIYQNIDNSLLHNLDPIEHLKEIEEQIKSINIPSIYLDYLDFSKFKLELRRNDNA